jgi:glycosyltransferase involved in cell wall biosynthesis
MKKLLISTDSFLPRWDGIARFLSEIIPVLAKDFKITVIAPKFGKIDRIPGVKYHQFPTGRIQYGDIHFAAFNYKKIRSIVKQHDVVFNQTIGPLGMSTIYAANKENVPIVQYTHSIDWELASKSVKRFQPIVHYGVKLLARYFNNKCSVVLVPSRKIEDKIVQNGITVKRLLVPMGVNTRTFMPPRNKRTVRKELGLNPLAFIVGFVGRIGREKDLPTLYRAFKKLRKQYPRCELVIVGAGLAQELPDDPAVTLTGPKDDVHKYLQAFDVFVLPSHTETSSLATMEAMSSELPVVVTPVGNIPEYVDDRHNGLLFPREDCGALLAKLQELYANESLRDRLAKNARHTIIRKYSWSKTIKQLRKILLDA